MAELIISGIELKDCWQGQEKKILMELLGPYLSGGLRVTKYAVNNIVKGQPITIIDVDKKSAQQLIPLLKVLGVKVEMG